MPSKAESDALSILFFLNKTPHPERGIREVSEATGIPYTDCHRWLSEEAWERFSRAEMRAMRRYRPSMYMQTVGTLVVDRDGIWVNRSKRTMLFKYAHRHGFDVLPAARFPYFVVSKVRADGLYWQQMNSDNPNLSLGDRTP